MILTPEFVLTLAELVKEHEKEGALIKIHDEQDEFDEFGETLVTLDAGYGTLSYILNGNGEYRQAGLGETVR